MTMLRVTVGNKLRAGLGHAAIAGAALGVLLSVAVLARQDGPAAAEVAPAGACGTSCHVLPPPDVLPRRAWRDSVERMQRILEDSEGVGPAAPLTLTPDFRAALDWYERRAPRSLEPPADWPAPLSRPRFEKRWLSPPEAPPTPVISNVQLLDVEGDEAPELIGCDMRHGMVFIGRGGRKAVELTPVAQLASPSHVTVVDLDGDGIRDLVVADLGEFLPRDHDKGAVVWLRGRGDGRYAPFAIGGLPRVADVRVEDFDADGDRDFLVAAFGYRKTGQVVLLENRTTDWATPAFAPHVLDPRPGAVGVEPIDLNGDGRLDFVTVISQQFEEVIAVINTGGLSFEPHLLYKAPHPNWGSSGLSLADLDDDGDVDVLLTNGDTFDDSLLKPYHGIAWLENTGDARPQSAARRAGDNAPPVAETAVPSFDYHRLASLPGPHGIRALDLDADDDLDIVVSALVAGGGGPLDARLPAVVWLEQVARRRFERRTLAVGSPRHASVAAGDADGDGRPDLVIGEMATTGPAEGWVQMWWNRGNRDSGEGNDE
jgi:hypothetical protein